MNLAPFLFKKTVRSIAVIIALIVLVAIYVEKVKADSNVPPTVTAPEGLTASDVTSDSITLYWTPVDGATGYNLYVSKYADKDFNKMNLAPLTATEYVDHGLFADETYYYKVTAVSAEGESGFSNLASAVTSDGNVMAQNFNSFMKGAAMDFTNEAENAGFVFKENGVAKDPFQSLSDHGVNIVRYGIHVDPVKHEPWHGKEQTLLMAKRVESAGMMFFADFSYSDNGADNKNQHVPPQWQGHTFEQLQQDVYNETYDVLKALKDQGTPAQMVQIGNELNGMLDVPDSDVASISAFLRAGVAAVKAVDPHIKIVIHYGGGRLTTFYDGIVANGVDFDVIGVSSYPVWGGTLANLQSNAESLAHLNKYFMPVETGYGWSATANYDSRPNVHGVQFAQLEDGYPATLEGQKNYLIDMMDVVAKLPNKMGVGMEYWPTDTVSIAPYYLSRNDNATFWYSDTGELVPSISAFEANVVRGTGVTTPFVHPGDGLDNPPVTIPVNLNVNFEQEAIGGEPKDWIFDKSGIPLSSTTAAVKAESSGGNRYLELNDNSTKGNIIAYKGFGSQTGRIKLAFRYKLANDPKYEAILVKADYKDAIQFSTTRGKLTLIGDSTAGQSNRGILDMTAGTWYTFQLDIDVHSNTFDLAINGTNMLSHQTFSTPAKFVDTLSFETLGSGLQKVDLDDILAVTVDDTPPVTKASVTGTVGQDNWYVSNAQVALSATDELSGVAKTVYSLNDSEWHLYDSPIVLSQDGLYALQYRSEDVAGNVEAAQSLSIKRDSTVPTFQLAANGGDLTSGQSFWDSELIKLDLTASDNLSGVASKSILVDGQSYTEGTELDFAGKPGIHTASVTVNDAAGNLTQAKISFEINASIDSIRKLLDRYRQDGELGGPLAPQLTNRLDQAQHQLDVERYDQAVEHMEDLIRSIENTPMQEHISDHAKAVVLADANSLIVLWMQEQTGVVQGLADSNHE